jgi:hypothetical protein
MFGWLNSVRSLGCICREKIGPGNLEGFATFDLREASQIDGQVHGAGGLAIQDKKN